MNMKILIVLMVIFSFNSGAEITLLNFNTMCDFCSGSKISEYPKRIESIQKLIKIYNPDLMSLQEFRTKSQVEELIKPFGSYGVIATESFLMSYADPAIVYNKDKFKLLDSENYWIGPDGSDSFTFGWKLSLPRQIIVAKFLDIKQNLQFYLVSSHFDNRIENLRGAASFARSILTPLDLPIIFAADTNLTVDMPAYKDMVKDLLDNAFDIKKEFSIIGQYASDKEICYIRKGKKFPQCRVDHVLLSKNSPWDVRKFMIETMRMDDGNFPSDHRPIIIRLTYKN